MTDKAGAPLKSDNPTEQASNVVSPLDDKKPSEELGGKPRIKDDASNADKQPDSKADEKDSKASDAPVRPDGSDVPKI